MPLVSKLLRGDARLQRCLVSDPDHVVPGSHGPHVGRIQQGLVTLGIGVITANEIAATFWGPTTTRAVRAFKGPPRNIVNRAYETAPDDIVGKMTIAQLDKELAEIDKLPVSRTVSVTEAGAPHDHTKCPRLEAGQHLATPINPLGFGRKINIFGDHETDYLGFEDYATDPAFVSRNEGGPRPLTFDPPLKRGLADRCASDICMRSSPVTDDAFTRRTGKPNTVAEIKRIAMPGCRLTYAGSSENISQFGPKVLPLGILTERVVIPDPLRDLKGNIVNPNNVMIALVITIL